jgi:hypothetical protein
MEKLPSDMKMELAKKLKGKDILNLCKTSKEMNKICSSDRYNALWQNKLKEDFNITYKGKDSYNKYTRELELYQRDFYQLVVKFDHDIDYSLFTTREEAVEAAIEIFLEDEGNYTNYYELREHFDENSEYENENNDLSCVIKLINLTREDRHYRKDKYEERKKKLQEKYGENYKSFLALIYHVEDQMYRHKYENVDAALNDLMGDFLPDEYLIDKNLQDDTDLEFFDNDVFRSTKNSLMPFFPDFD